MSDTYDTFDTWANRGKNAIRDTCIACKELAFRTGTWVNPPAIVFDDGRSYCKIHYLLLMRDIVKEKTMKNFEVNFSKQKEE